MDKVIFNEYQNKLIDSSFIDLTCNSEGIVYCLYMINQYTYEIKSYRNNEVEKFIIRTDCEINLLRTYKDHLILISILYTSFNPNVFIYSKTGDRVSSFYAGNGIVDCKVTTSGEIWICYDEEVIFEEGSIGQNGIVCYSQKGEVFFDDFNNYVEADLVHPIDHCYAVSLINDDVWIAYYSTDLRIVKLDVNENAIKTVTLEFIPIDAFGVGVKNGFIDVNQELIKFDLFSRKQKKVKPYHISKGYLKFEKILIQNDIIFGVANHHLYYSKID